MHKHNKSGWLPVTVLATAAMAVSPLTQADIDSSNSFSGYVKTDILFDAENDASASHTRNQSLITLNENEAENEEGDLNMSSLESRLKFAHTSTGTPVGNLKAVIEGDFFSGSSSVFNLRHAYLQQDNLTIGRTWSTFMDLGALAETADFGGPAARIFSRKSLVRYAIPMGNNTLELAAEQPINSEDPDVPDLVAKYTTKTGFGHLSAGILMQKINVGDEVKDDSAMAFAGRFSGRINIADDNLKFSLISGSGLGGYMNFGDVAAYDFSGDSLELSKQTGVKLAYQHVFSPSLRSTLRLAKTTASLDGNDMGDFSSMHLNLVYNAYQPLKYGVELIKATKKQAEGNTFTEDLKLNRLHMFAKLAF
ncbi:MULTISPECIES: DcaP family trimeric outer membrane transporter [unclassified Oceanobacter]|uniref:DcaP family trimeric outer membrane transporter n=1 Tax=unclassified Oceanobacter TaxID=2620260 RepID=UPI0027365B57|nr:MULTISPECIES: DcaP family trimeric outer membrane transporter [unclassified Oceanobacter]MDP2610542.1 DcaP family trimeric outer membrane transporter [Oceanobacter sp. 1_MG-2023]MDP2613799.1 DcaP family trimeric outer membrane transporter [Oceanobacter sp. 2_MG-2023]